MTSKQPPYNASQIPSRQSHVDVGDPLISSFSRFESMSFEPQSRKNNFKTCPRAFRKESKGESVLVISVE